LFLVTLLPGQYVDITGFTIGKGFQGRARFLEIYYLFYF